MNPSMRTRARRLAASLLISLTLGACASTEVQRERARSSLDSAQQRLAAQPAAAGFKDPGARVGGLEKGLETYALDHTRPVSQLSGGLAYYIVLELPAFQRGYQIEIFPVNELIAANALAQTGTSATIWPAVTLLDEKLEPIASRMPRYRDEGDRYLMNAGIFGYISVCDARPRYIAVHGLPPIYRRVSSRTMTTYSQYGSSTSQGSYVQMPEGTIKLGLPTKPVGKSIFGGKEVPPCSEIDQSVEAYLLEIGG